MSKKAKENADRPPAGIDAYKVHVDGQLAELFKRKGATPEKVLAWAAEELAAARRSLAVAHEHERGLARRVVCSELTDGTLCAACQPAGSCQRLEVLNGEYIHRPNPPADAGQ